MPHASDQLPPSARRLLWFAKLASWAGLLLFAATVVWGIIILFRTGNAFDAILAESFLDKGNQAAFSIGQRSVGGAIMVLSTASGIYGLWLAQRLFSGYLRGSIFTLTAAHRLRLIGWMVVLLFPMSVIGELLGRFLFTRWVQPERVTVELSVGDGDVFALVFGLLIVVVGHVMYQAISISEENQSFV